MTRFRSLVVACLFDDGLGARFSRSGRFFQYSVWIQCRWRVQPIGLVALGLRRGVRLGATASSQLISLPATVRTDVRCR